MGLLADLEAFEARHKIPYPPPLAQWHHRWMRAIERAMARK